VLEHALEAIDAEYVKYVELGHISPEKVDSGLLARCLQLVCQCAHPLSRRRPCFLLNALSIASGQSINFLPSFLQNLWIPKLELKGDFVLARTLLLDLVLSCKNAGAALYWLRIDKLVLDEEQARDTLLSRLRALITSVECGLDRTIEEGSGTEEEWDSTDERKTKTRRKSRVRRTSKYDTIRWVCAGHTPLII
jgi:hypothetical protein